MGQWSVQRIKTAVDEMSYEVESHQNQLASEETRFLSTGENSNFLWQKCLGGLRVISSYEFKAIKVNLYLSNDLTVVFKNLNRNKPY